MTNEDAKTLLVIKGHLDMAASVIDTLDGMRLVSDLIADDAEVIYEMLSKHDPDGTGMGGDARCA